MDEKVFNEILGIPVVVPRDGNKPRPNTPERYNAQYYRAEPLEDLWTPIVTERRFKRCKRWLSSPFGRASPAPRHIAEDIENFRETR